MQAAKEEERGSEREVKGNGLMTLSDASDIAPAIAFEVNIKEEAGL